MEHKKFNPPKYRCKSCKTTIWSRQEGEFRYCSCGSIAVDSTAHYTRLIGEPNLFEKVEEE